MRFFRTFAAITVVTAGVGAASASCVDDAKCLRNSDCPSNNVCTLGACTLAPVEGGTTALPEAATTPPPTDATTQPTDRASADGTDNFDAWDPSIEETGTD